MSEVEQRREPSCRSDRRAQDSADARAAKVRRNAWLLAGLAVFFYVGYMAWMFIRAIGG